MGRNGAEIGSAGRDRPPGWWILRIGGGRPGDAIEWVPGLKDELVASGAVRRDRGIGRPRGRIPGSMRDGRRRIVGMLGTLLLGLAPGCATMRRDAPTPDLRPSGD